VPSSAQAARPGFAANTLWTWTSVAVSFATAAIVSPLMVTRLGEEAYGLWALAFGVTEYYSIADLGVRAAVLKYVAHYWTLGDSDGLNRTLSSAFVYFGAVGALILAVALAVAPYGPSLFVVSPAMADTFVFVLTAVGASFALIFGVSWLNAVLESVQRFDLSYRIIIVANLARVVGTIAVLLAGFGLATVVLVMVAARVLQCILVYRAFRRHFSEWRWARSGVNWTTFRQLFGFSIFAFPSNVSLVFIEHGPAVVIGHQLPVEFVGYYMLPRRLMQIVMDLVHGVGAVTVARSAELGAKRDQSGLVKLGVFTNRYAMLMCVPASVFLLLYGHEVFSLWLTPSFAAYSAPILAVFAVGYLLADAGQFSSSAILYGLARHQFFSVLLIGEALATVTLVYHFANAGNLFYAAIAASVAMVISRGLLTPYVLCRHLRYPALRYLAEIAARPLLVGVASGLVMWWAKTTWLPGVSFLEIAVAMTLTTALCVVLGGRLCVLPEHRAWAIETVRQRAPLAERVVRLLLGIPHTKI
jgi:O-antigen/teichoic acid export membrane protein